MTRTTPRLSERPKPPEIRAADPNRRSAQREGFKNIRTTTETAIHEHGNLPAGCSHAFRQRFDSRADLIQLPRPMVGHNDSRQSVFDGELGVLGGHHSFDNHRELASFSQPLQRLPCRGWKWPGLRRVPGRPEDVVWLVNQLALCISGNSFGLWHQLRTSPL